MAKINVNTELREAYLAATAATIGSVLEGSRLSALHAAQVDGGRRGRRREAARIRHRRSRVIRRLDHVAVAVKDTEAALAYFRDRLGLRVAAVDEPPEVPVRLTYLDLGNTWLQLVEPLDPAHPLAAWLEANGDGLHHICFGVDDVECELLRLEPARRARSAARQRARPARGLRGRRSAARRPHRVHGLRPEERLRLAPSADNQPT